MKFIERSYPESRFGGFTNVDGTIAFYSRINALLEPSSIVVDVGCGRGAYAEDKVAWRRNLRVLKGKCATVIGIDVDPAASNNPFLDEFRMLDGERWPIDDASVDLCVSDSVLEHVAEPEKFFAECRRVLKPGGYLCLRTPNVLSYFGLVSRLVPNRFHARTVAKAQTDPDKPLSRHDEDVFPTLYRCNTRGRLRRALARHDFDSCVLGHEAEPSYFSFSRLLYCLGVAHQRLSPNLFKVVLFAFARKPEQPPG
ncbi:class I SAM-dependent methyltransferase [Candidatus Sumerlaeota bacterium]